MKKSTLLVAAALSLLALLTAPSYAHKCTTCPSFRNTASVGVQNLAALEGCWRGSSREGQRSEVSYEMGSDGTALLETQWVENWPPVYTMYYMDGTGVSAKHFCSMGNQVQMRGVEAKDGSRIDFQFVAATNMQKASQPHMTRTSVSFTNPDNIVVEWASSCDPDEEDQVTVFTYERVVEGCNVGKARTWSEK